MAKLFKSKIAKNVVDKALDPPENPTWVAIREETEKDYKKELDRHLKLGYSIYSMHIKEVNRCYAAMLVKLI